MSSYTTCPNIPRPTSGPVRWSPWGCSMPSKAWGTGPSIAHSAPLGWRSTYFSRGHFAHAQLPPTVVCWHRIRGDTPNTCTSGAWYGARAPDYRSIPSPTSAYCEGLCGQDRLGRDDSCHGADGNGHRSRDHCPRDDPRYVKWPESPVSLGRVLHAPRYRIVAGQ